VSRGLVFLGCEEVDWEAAPVLGEKCCTAKLAPKALVEHGTISLEEWLEVHGPITRPGRCIPCEGWEPEEEGKCKLEWRMKELGCNVGKLTVRKGQESKGWPGVSGLVGHGPEDQCVQGVGPIPEGPWTAGYHDWFPNGPHGWWNECPGEEIKGPCLGIKNRPVCGNRKHFRIHQIQTSIPQTQGCIALTPYKLKKLREWMDKHECTYPLDLVVDYSGAKRPLHASIPPARYATDPRVLIAV